MFHIWQIVNQIWKNNLPFMEMSSQALIDAALEKAGGPDQLADRIAYEARTLRRVRSGEIALSSKLRGLLERYLAEGRTILQESPAYAKPAFNVDPRPLHLRKIPVYTFVQAGQATAYEGLPTAWGDEIEYDGADEKAFALRVSGDSMAPNFPPGTIITVSPKHPPHNGHLVVAKIKEEGVLFKLFHHSGDGKKITLTSYNSAYPPISLAREQLHWIYRVVRATQNL